VFLLLTHMTDALLPKELRYRRDECSV